MIDLTNVKRVRISEARWSVTIEIELADGTTQAYVASADSGVAESGIWFGTNVELAEELERLW